MIKLNLEGRNEVRTLLVERLKDSNFSPENRVKLDDLVDLEEILFEKIVYTRKDGKKDIIKLPVWFGSFLSKIDLSQVSFEDVSWSMLRPKSAKAYLLLDAENEEELEERFFYLQPGGKINYENTNAVIYFSKSWEAKHTSNHTICIRNCDFSCTSLRNNRSRYAYNAYNSDFSFTEIDFPFNQDHRFVNCNLEELDFHNRIIKPDELFTYFKECNLKNTDINILIDDPKSLNNELRKYIIEQIDSQFLNGCYINKKRIYGPSALFCKKDEVQKKYLKEKRQFLSDISQLIDDQSNQLSRK